MIRIIGLGSPFGDDQVGWRVVAALQGRLPESVDLVTLDRPGAALINWMQDVQHLVLIDAISSEAPPGSLLRLDPAELISDQNRLTSHDLALSETLRLADSLNCLPARIDLYGIELGGCTDDDLSPVAETAAEKLALQLSYSFA